MPRDRRHDDWEAGDPSSFLSSIVRDGAPYPDGEAPTLDELLKLSKHDEACLRRRDQPGWRYICSCGMTDAEVAKAFTKCECCDELPPEFPFPDCKCFE